LNLYEITNGYSGCAYVRCYAWAENESQALALATEVFRQQTEDRYRPYPKNYWEQLECKLLFSEDSEPFVTEPDDTGWIKT